jgi:hypothetical protein
MGEEGGDDKLRIGHWAYRIELPLENLVQPARDLGLTTEFSPQRRGGAEEIRESTKHQARKRQRNTKSQAPNVVAAC